MIRHSSRSVRHVWFVGLENVVNFREMKSAEEHNAHNTFTACEKSSLLAESKVQRTKDLQGDPTEVNSGNWCILYAVW